VRIIRSLVAVLAGFGFLLFAGFVAGSLSTLVAKLLVTALSALMAGWMTARLAEFSAMGHAAVLALFAAAASLSLISAGNTGGWYATVSAFISVVGILVGGWIRAAAGHARGTV
jgi:ABC-type uncharacterized transport system permease subunit